MLAKSSNVRDTFTCGASGGSRTRVASLENWNNGRYTTLACRNDAIITDWWRPGLTYRFAYAGAIVKNVTLVYQVLWNNAKYDYSRTSRPAAASGGSGS